MLKRAKPKTEVTDWTDHVFEFRKGGVVYEARHRVYVDQADGKKKDKGARPLRERTPSLKRGENNKRGVKVER